MAALLVPIERLVAKHVGRTVRVIERRVLAIDTLFHPAVDVAIFTQVRELGRVIARQIGMP